MNSVPVFPEFWACLSLFHWKASERTTAAQEQKSRTRSTLCELETCRRAAGARGCVSNIMFHVPHYKPEKMGFNYVFKSGHSSADIWSQSNYWLQNPVNRWHHGLITSHLSHTQKNVCEMFYEGHRGWRLLYTRAEHYSEKTNGCVRFLLLSFTSEQRHINLKSHKNQRTSNERNIQTNTRNWANEETKSKKSFFFKS